MDGYRYLRLIVPLVSFLLYANLVHAMQLKLSFEEVAQTADLIFIGTVEKQNSRLNEKNTMVFTDVSFKNVVVVHSTNQSVQRDSSTIQLTYAGGSAGDVSITLSDSPSFEDGHRYLICMLDDGKTYTSPIIGGTQGLFEILKDIASKEEFVLTAGKKAVIGVNKEITTSRKRVSSIQEGKLIYEPSEKDVSDRFYPQPPTPFDPADSASISPFLTEKDAENLSPLRLKGFLDYVKDVALKAPFERKIPRRNGRGYFFFKDENGKVRKKRLPRAKPPVKTPNEAQNPDGESHIPLNVPVEDVNPSASDRSIQPRGGQLGRCGYHDLYIEMEQVPGSWWSYIINEDCMRTWNHFMDVYRSTPDDGGYSFSCGINNDNEFAGFLNTAFGTNWGPGVFAVTLDCSYTACGEIKEADVAWNAAYNWTNDPAISIGNPGVVLLRPVDIHELGHVWGEQRRDYKETYDYDVPTVMHSYYSAIVEDGWGIHADDAYLIRRNYYDQTTTSRNIDIGVESYYAQGGLLNSYADKASYIDIDKRPYYPGESITLIGVTVENMSIVPVDDLWIRFFLSSDRIRDISDRQMGGYWYWDTFDAETYNVSNYKTTIPSDIIPGTYYVVANVTYNGDYFYEDGNWENNTTTFYAPITIKPCSFTMSSTSSTFGSSGGTGNVMITGPNECGWSAWSNDSWITITSRTSGQGNGFVSYIVSANRDAIPRTGTMAIAGDTFYVYQDGAGCSYTIAPTSQSFGSAKGTGSVSVTAPRGCNWTARSNAPWIRINSRNSGNGNGTVKYSVEANGNTVTRTGTLTIAGQTFTITQALRECLRISPASQRVGSPGGTGYRIAVITTDSACPWIASSNVSWITTGGNGPGTGTVLFSVAPNPDSTIRTGIITIGGQFFNVIQSGLNCTYNISPQKQSFDDGGGAGSISVTAPDSRCPWTASSQASWITITSGSSGGGNGLVSYSVADNPNPTAREGMITAAGRGFVVTQSGVSCGGYSIYPTNASFSELGGTAGVSVIAPNKCNWTAGSNVSWITITSGDSGTGIGRVDYSVAANPDESQRTGTMTIAEQTFTVTQLALSCFIRLSPAERWIADSGGTGSVDVTVASGCSWSISSNVSWITITSGSSGNGNGTVYYTAAANPDTSTRMGILTIGPNTQIHTVKQHGAGCTYSIFPYNHWFDSSGGTESIDVTAPSGCNWLAGSNVPWITIISGNSGSGNGTVNYSVAPIYSDYTRVGTMTIGGQTFTVTQYRCGQEIYISFNSDYFPAAGGTGSINVTAPSACSWTASSNRSWITITSGNSGSGDGTVNFSVAPNGTGNIRIGIITIGGKTFSLQQSAR